MKIGSTYLWPSHFLIGGIAFFMSLFRRDRDEFGLGLVAFSFTLGNAGPLENLVKFWPVLPILAVGWILLKQVLRAKK